MRLTEAITKLLPWPGLRRRRARTSTAVLDRCYLIAPDGTRQHVEGTYEIGHLRRVLEDWERQYG